MNSETLREGVADLVADRAAVIAGIAADEKPSLCDFLVSAAGIGYPQAQALVNGEGASFNASEIDQLAAALSFERDLLACALCPTSSEMVEHTLRQAAETLTEGCPQCQPLIAQAGVLPTLDDDEIAELCLGMLEHLLVSDEEDPLLGERPSSRMARLSEVFSELDPDAQARVLAYAYSELGGSVGDPRPAQTEALWRLRHSHLSSLAVRVFDELCRRGPLSSVELIRLLGLRNGRSLGQLQRSVERSLRDLAHTGHQLESPLLVRRSRHGTIFELKPAIAAAWESMLSAELTLSGAPTRTT